MSPDRFFSSGCALRSQQSRLKEEEKVTHAAWVAEANSLEIVRAALRLSDRNAQGNFLNLCQRQHAN